MTSRRYCTLDPACGPGLLVQEGQLTATTTANALDLHRCIKGNLAASSGDYYYEVVFYSNLQASLANLVSFGVCQASAALDKYVGEESVSYGWRFADGAIYNNNASVASAGIYPERTAFGCYCFLSPGVCTLAFVVNGVYVQSVSLPTGKAWLPAFTISGPTAGDQKLQVNFGQSLFDWQIFPNGWSQQAPGLATLYLSKATEAFMSAHTDSPADQSYLPKLLNLESFSIKRAPQHWAHRTSAIEVAPVPSSYAPLLLDNTDGDFNALLAGDVRDSATLMDMLNAPAGGFGSIAAATRMFTANIDTVSAPDVNTVEVTLRGNIARMDVPMKVHLIPNYYASASAGKMKPFGIGAQRNANAVLLDEGQNLWLLGDTQFSNVPLVMDNAAPLDPLTPQYTGALSGMGLKLLQPSVGKLSFDGSTIGPQYQAGVSDVLGGIGAFTTWTAGVPNGWTKAASPAFPSTVYNNGTITQDASHGAPSACMISSNVPYTPSGVGFFYGYPLYTSSVVFQPGRTYRISFKMLYCIGTSPTCGLAIMSGLADDPRYWITDWRSPITIPSGRPPPENIFTYEYTAPSTLATALPLYLCVISTFGGTAPSTPSCVVVIDDLKVELLGQFTQAPLSTVPLDGAMHAILVQHQGESSSVYSTSDAQAIQNATKTSSAFPDGYVWGLRYTEAPNVCDAMQTALDTFGAVMFEDEQNVIRFRRLTDPATGTAVVQFDTSNVDPDSISIRADDAPGLTTRFWARPNCDPNADNDFVTNTGIVTPATKAALMGPGQYNVEATVTPAAEYAAAQGAPRFLTRFDDPGQCLIEGNRVNSIWAQKYVNGVLSNGKRRIVTLTAFFEGLSLGVGSLVVQPQQLYYNDVALINLPKHGLTNVQGAVISTELFPFAGKITVEVLV